MMIRQIALLLLASTAFSSSIDFSRQIRPILSENCFFCHGPDEAKREAGLRLDDERAAKSDNDGVIAIIPGDPDGSALIQRIITTDPDEVMPPPKLHKKVSPAQVELLKQWIKEGAKWGGHWSYERVTKPAVPPVAAHPIDAFLLQRLKAERLTYSELADTPTLIRRLALDLTGLPPTLDELQRFEKARYEDVVDYYLSRPAYGEHWGQQWLDLARYADSSGYPSDQPREIWAYRDWVIRALNSNMPFDQFTIEQLAGDLLPHPTDDQLIATAFHRNTMTQNEGGTDDEEFRNAAIIDRVNTTFAVWMGTTMACAQCHTHKYDPISIKEYFQFYAFLNQSADSDKKDEVPLHTFHTSEQQNLLKRLRQEISELERQFASPSDVWLTGFEAWQANVTGGLTWHTPKPEGLSTASKQAPVVTDDAYVSIPQAQTTDRYTLELKADGGQLRALRLETLPASGFGNFVLTDVKAEIVSPPGTKVENARFVRVDLPGKKRILQLAEVEVLSSGKNIATGGTAKQSSLYADAAARRAIDGNTEGDYHKGSVAHTSGSEDDPWWEVDLKNPQAIDHIRLWNRTDGNTHSRIQGAIVSVLDAKRRILWQSHAIAPPEKDLLVSLSAPIPVTFHAALADYEQKGFPASSLLEPDQKKRTGWAVAGAADKPHTLTLMVNAPLQLPEKAVLRVTLSHESKYAKHVLGKFRLGYTGDERVQTISQLPPNILSILSTPSSSRMEEQTQALRLHYARHVSPTAAAERHRLGKLQTELAAIKSVTVPIMKDLVGKDRRETKIQLRGNWQDLGETVSEATPAAFHPLPQNEPRNRLTMAKWLVSRDNPLTARVTVNRLWETLFGTGIVRTSEEFGSQGELPFHPELLDWLAAEFMDSGWNMKHMLKLMVTTTAYRQISRSSDTLNERDPDNRLLARGPRFRPTGEQLRDQALAVSGLLSSKMYGPPVRPMAPGMGLSTAFGRSNDWTTSTGEDRHRRGIYTEVRRNAPYASFTTFDAGNREVCMIRRNRTNTPLQAFVTLNDPVFVETHQAMARRLMQEATDTTSRIRLLSRLCLARDPSDQELATLTSLHQDALSTAQTDLSAAAKLATDPLGPAPQNMDIVELAAWTTVANVVMNMDEFLMRR